MNRKPEQGCLSSACWFASDRSGQRVNGPCTCLDRVPLQQRLVIKKYVYNLKKQLDDAGVNELIQQVEELLGRIDALEETLLDNKICVACLNPLDNCTCEAPL